MYSLECAFISLVLSRLVSKSQILYGLFPSFLVGLLVNLKYYMVYFLHSYIMHDEMHVTFLRQSLAHHVVLR
jgi:hypothetical protein